ncbi:hypothetical protein CK203_112836 [Vitis vinifera]|uniref:Uncharacterized protein n=1 Tax=Vitis vinifera TaxID=29760 RepID=A0A438C575_VITVI|nr:hypothetical protein CK203_112836 [Vitis vinifera]
MDSQVVTIAQFPCAMALIHETDATPLPVVAPVPILEDAHAHMDRFEQRMRRMRVSNGAISWDDFDGAPVANLPAQFRMPDIERALLEDCGSSLPLLTQKGRSPQDDRDQKMCGFKVTSYFIPSALNPTDCYSSCIETDMTVLPARYAFESSFQKLMKGGLLTQLALRPISQPVPLRFRMDLHCSYHQDSMSLRRYHFLPLFTIILATLRQC